MLPFQVRIAWSRCERFVMSQLYALHWTFEALTHTLTQALTPIIPTDRKFLDI